MIQRLKAEKVLQKIIRQYDQGVQKEILFWNIVREFHLDVKKGIQEQIEVVLERSLTSSEKDKINTLSFLQHHGLVNTRGFFLRVMILLLIGFAGIQLFVNLPLSQSTHPATSFPASPTVTLLYSTKTPIILTDTPRPFLPLIIGAWHDDSSDCYSENNDKWVLITGVEISGGIPPYYFRFEQLGHVLAEAQIFPVNNLVEFDPPILVNKGAYAIVKVMSATQTGEPSWSSGIYYSSNPNCDK